MATAIQKVSKLYTLDKAGKKFAITLLLNWNALSGDVVNLASVLSLPIIATERLGFLDTFSLLNVNQAASQNVPPIKQVMGIVSLFPQSTADQQKPAGGLYLVTDVGQIVALEQKTQSFEPPTQEVGLVDPGSISFSVPLEMQSVNSTIQIAKLTDNAASGGTPMTGSATLTFLTYNADTYMR